MITIGELVSVLFGQYEAHYHDDKLAAVATQRVIDQLLREHDRARRRRRIASHAKLHRTF